MCPACAHLGREICDDMADYMADCIAGRYLALSCKFAAPKFCVCVRFAVKFKRNPDEALDEPANSLDAAQDEPKFDYFIRPVSREREIILQPTFLSAFLKFLHPTASKLHFLRSGVRARVGARAHTEDIDASFLC